MKDIFIDYKEQICQNCKAEVCKRNIMVIYENKTKTIKCIDYVKDENKIIAPDKLYIIAKQQRKVMR